MGSEPYVGWNWAKIVGDKFDLHVITREHHRIAISNACLKDVTFHYFDLPGFKRLDHRSKWMKLYYLLWQGMVFFKVILLHVRFRYELVHHVTYNNLDVPGFLWLLPNTKFVWGPVGGGQVPAAAFKRVFGDRGWRKQLLRAALKKGARYNPIVRLALWRASVVMFANRDTEGRFAGVSIKRSRIVLETAISPAPGTRERAFGGTSDFSVLWVGQVEPRKALMMAIDAIAFIAVRGASRRRIVLDVVGDGPELEKMRQEVVSRNLEDIVRIHGKVTFSDVGGFFERADLFLFTSVQDTSGNVVLEAMSHSVPTIALNHQGVKEILGQGGGVLVEPNTYEGTCEGIAREVVRLCGDDEARIGLGREARQSVVDNFSWSAKSRMIKDIYYEILG